MSGYDFDLFVIGGGSGGVRAARMAAQRGARVALAEQSGLRGLGGTCVNVGCIPKKLYSYAAGFGHDFESSHGFGWKGEAPRLDWDLLKANRRKEIQRLNGVYLNLLKSAGVTVIEAHTSLAGPNAVAADGRVYSAQHILLATGGRPQVPGVTGAELACTSDEMFDLDPFPRRLLVVGGGYIACEFASIFQGLGSQVTQVHRGPQILRGFDGDVRQFLASELRKTGIDLRLDSGVERIARGDGVYEVDVRSPDGRIDQIVVDRVLYATGRVPNTRGLGLHEAGVEIGKDGAVVVGAHYETSVPSILAIGDLVGRMQLTPVALGEAMVVVDHLFGPAAGRAERSMSYQFVPTAVFTHPSVGTVGYSEEDARTRFGKVTVYRSEFKALLHTLSGSTERTLMKLVVDDASDRVVGLHMVGSEAGEIVQGFAVAMKAGATKAVFDSTIGIHPTAAEEFVTMREAVRPA